MTDEEKAHARELLMDPRPELEKVFGAKIWQPDGQAIPVPG